MGAEAIEFLNALDNMQAAAKMLCIEVPKVVLRSARDGYCLESALRMHALSVTRGRHVEMSEPFATPYGYSVIQVNGVRIEYPRY